MQKPAPQHKPGAGKAVFWHPYGITHMDAFLLIMQRSFAHIGEGQCGDLGADHNRLPEIG